MTLESRLLVVLACFTVMAEELPALQEGKALGSKNSAFYGPFN
ncbi:MAG: hypothetical protein ACR2N1_21595 [Rubripirellula sp.]